MTKPARRRLLAAAGILAALMLAGCGVRPGAAVTVTWAQPPLRILAVGDSITADGQWQAELDRLLDEAGVDHVIDTEAVPGSRCNYWPSRIGALLDAHQPDLVAFFCGTNDDPTERIYGEPVTGWSFRVVSEAVHAHGARMLPGLIGYSDPLVAPDWLLRNEPRTNDILWPNIALYLPHGWFPGVANFQQLPATADYLDDGGIHPTAAGYRAMGRIVYDSAAPGMGWPPAGEPPLCGMYGHRKGYPRPTYTPCGGG